MSNPEQAPALPERGERRSWFTGRTREEQIAYKEDREDRRVVHNRRAIAKHRSMNYGRGPDDGDRDPSGNGMGWAIGGALALIPCELGAYAIITSAGVATGGIVIALALAASPLIAIYLGGQMYRTYEPR